MNLNQSTTRRMAFYKSKMPTHGKTLREVIRNYWNPSYTSRGPSPSFANAEDMARRYPVKGWYGFPGDINPGRFPKPSDFGKLWGMRCIGAAGTLESNSNESRYASATNRQAEGYYMDSHHDMTVYPLVFMLSKKRGFLTGRYESDNGEVYIHNEIHDDARDAFYAAHDDCARYAEDCRECYAKDMAESEIAELREDIRNRRGYILQVISEAKANCPALDKMPAVKDIIRDGISTAMVERRKAFKRIATLESNYWAAVE